MEINEDNSKKVTNSSARTPEPDFLVIGQIVKPHGIRGEVLVKVLTDFPERFDTMKNIYLGDKTSAQMYRVKATRWHKDKVLCTFETVLDRDAAEKLRGLYLEIPIEEAMPLDPDTYYHHQLIDLAAVTDEGVYLGQVTEILETGANDVYIIHGPRGEILLPATMEVIVSIDLEARQMTVHLLEGLI
jgi:16S rRNA processing protein RimM